MDNIELIEWSIMIMCCSLLGMGINGLLPSSLNYQNKPLLIIFMAFSIPLIYYCMKLEFFVLKKVYTKYFNKINKQ